MRILGQGLRLGIPETSPSCGVLPGSTVDKPRCEFEPVDDFCRDLASRRVRRHVVLDQSFHLEFWHADIDRMIAVVPYANENADSPIGTCLVIL